MSGSAIGRVLEVLPGLNEPVAVTSCPHCFRSFHAKLSLEAGLPFAMAACTNCLSPVRIDPSSFDQLTPSPAEPDHAWFRLAPFAEALTYRGVDLGEAAAPLLATLVSNPMTTGVIVESTE